MATKQPADQSHFILPDLGEGVHEAELIKWRVAPGETVEEHQVLAEMETDKALVEVPSPWAGTVTKLNGGEGDILLVGSILVEYEGKGGGGSKAPATATEQVAAAVPEASTDEEADAGTVVGSVDAALTVSDAFTRRRPEAAAPTTSRKALATPAVRRIARERGVNINQVSGSGRGGRVTASDVMAFVGGGGAGSARSNGGHASPATLPASISRPSTGSGQAPSTGSGQADQNGIAERIPFRGVRRKIAEALSRSVKTAVHFTVVDEADVTALDAKRREYARVLGHKLSMLPFIMMAVTRALRVHPSVNANVDDENGEILIRSVINLGCAVDTNHGLMVPVIPSADTLGIVQLADAVRSLAKGARDRTIERERLQGGTFTISNVGSYGGMFATPIINYPEVAILAAGRSKERVLVKKGAFYAGLVLPLSLSCDHRVVDGAEGARFLNTVVALLEDPAKLLGD